MVLLGGGGGQEEEERSECLERGDTLATESVNYDVQRSNMQLCTNC